MTDQEEHDRAGTLSVRDMQEWLKDEVRDSAKAHELRVKDATELVTAYAEGKLTTEQAMERMVQFDHRWGEALFGSAARPGIPNETILQEIDAAREDVATRRIASRTGRGGSTTRY
jgi:hypothetical protein